VITSLVITSKLRVYASEQYTITQNTTNSPHFMMYYLHVVLFRSDKKRSIMKY